MKTLIVIVLILFSSSASAEYRDWDQERKNIFLAYNIISTIDLLQTTSALNDPCNCYKEANPLLGSYPSDETLIAVTLLGNYAMYKWLDQSNFSRNDRIAAKAAVFTRLVVVAHNHSVGVRIDIPF